MGYATTGHDDEDTSGHRGAQFESTVDTARNVPAIRGHSSSAIEPLAFRLSGSSTVFVACRFAKGKGLSALKGTGHARIAAIVPCHNHVLPSLREGFPNVVLEAAAMGVATVTTDATGSIDSVRPRETGLIVKTGNGNEIAGAIRLLLGEPTMRKRMSVAGRDWVVTEFNPELVVRSLLSAETPGSPERRWRA